VPIKPESEQFLGAALLGIEGDNLGQSITSLIAPYTVRKNSGYIHLTVTNFSRRCSTSSSRWNREKVIR
jgi:hypothetical protein